MRILEQRLWNIGDSQIGLLQEIIQKQKTLASVETEIQADQNNPRLWAQKMILFDLNGKPEQALQVFEQAPMKSDTLYSMKGLSLIKSRNDYQNGIAAFEQALEINPLNIEARTSLATCLSRLQRYEEALDLWDKLIEMNPNWADAWNGRAKCYYWLGDYERAVKSVTAALFCLETGHCLSAIQTPRDKITAGFYKNRANAYLKMDNEEAALKDFLESAKIDPSDKDSVAAASQLLMKRNRIKEAIRIGKAYIAQNPDDDGWHLGMMALYAGASDLPGVEKSFAEIQRIVGNQLGAFHYFSYAVSLSAGGWLKKALKAFDEALECTTDKRLRAECFQHLLTLTDKLNDFTKQRSYMEQATREGMLFMKM